MYLLIPQISLSLQKTMAVPSRFIELDSLSIGQRIECVFVAPDKGRVTINLLSKSGNIPLHHDIRYDWGSGWKNSLNLNSKISGSWGNEERPGGFDFTHGKPVTVKIVAAQLGFEIYCNGTQITTFNYRSGLPATDVKKVQWVFEDNGASMMPQLQTITVGYDSM